MRNHLTVTIIGRSENTAVVTYLYSILHSQFIALARSGWAAALTDIRQLVISRGISKDHPAYKKPWTLHIGPTPKKWRISFFLGAVRGIYDRLDAQHNQLEQNPAVTALVLNRTGELDQYCEQHHPNTSAMPQHRPPIDSTAYQLGLQAGRNANMNPGLNSAPDSSHPQLPE